MIDPADQRAPTSVPWHPSAARGGAILALGASVACGIAQPSAEPRTDVAAAAAVAVSGDTAHLVVTRPTVIAYLVVAPGAVDTNPDLSIVADDWNYAVSAFGDSLEAHGFALALVTEARLRLGMAGAADTVLALDGGRVAAGYVFARPGEPPCLRPGAAELDSLLAAARAWRDAPPHARARDACGAPRR